MFGLNPTNKNDEEAVNIFKSIQARINLEPTKKKAKRKATSTQAHLVKDERFKIQVVGESPCLQVTLTKIETEMLTGEVQLVTVEMINGGNSGLCNLLIGTTTPHLLFYQLPDVPESLKELSAKDTYRKKFVRKLILPENNLEPGKKFSFNMYLKAPQLQGNYYINFLIYYQNVKEVPK